MHNLNNLTGNPNKSNRGSANGPPCWQHIQGDDDWATAPPRQPVAYKLDRICPAVACSIGFNDLTTFQSIADPSTTLPF